MKISKLLILVGAALAGSAVYKLVFAPPSDNDFYAGLTGPGSLMQAYRDARDSQQSGLTLPGTSGGIGAIGNPYGESRTDSNHIPTHSTTRSDDQKLLQAAARGDKAAVMARLDKKVNVDSRDAEGRSALAYAAWAGHNDICARLLAAGAHLHLEDRRGYNALDYAAGRGLTDTVEQLLNYAHAEDVNHYQEYAALMRAAYRDAPASLPAGKLVTVNRINPDGQAPLFIAAGNGSLPMLEALLARGGKVTQENLDGRTPLHWAAWNNQPQAVEFLLAHGADARQIDHAGTTALMQAAQHNSLDAARMLLLHGADKYQANRQGKTASMIAEDSGFKEMAALLK